MAKKSKVQVKMEPEIKKTVQEVKVQAKPEQIAKYKCICGQQNQPVQIFYFNYSQQQVKKVCNILCKKCGKRYNKISIQDIKC